MNDGGAKKRRCHSRFGAQCSRSNPAGDRVSPRERGEGRVRSEAKTGSVLNEASCIGRAAGKLLRQLSQVHPIALFERPLADLMLLHVMRTAKADRPSIRGFHRQPTIRIAPDVRTFDQTLLAARDRAPVPSHPSAMSRALARIASAGAFTLKSFRKLQLSPPTTAPSLP